MEHKERIRVAKYILNKLKAKYKNKILVGGVYGSVAINKDTKDSDLDIILITKDKTGRIRDDFMYKGIPVSYWSKELKDTKNLIKNPNLHDWPWSLNTFLNFKVLVGDKNIPKKLREQYKKVPIRKYKKAIQDCLPSTYEWYAKVQKSYRKKDYGNLIWAIWDTVNAILGCIALLNRKYFTRNGYNRYKESFNYKIKPKNYKKLVEIAWKSKDPHKNFKAFNQLFKNFEKLLLDQNIEAKKYNKLDEIKI